MKRAVAVLAAVVMVPIGLLQLEAASAAQAASVAGPGTSLPCSSIGQMLVDSATSHVFVTCPATNSVAVLSNAGSLLATLTNIAGASGLADDGTNVYVTAENSGTIDSINPSTFAVTNIGVSGLVDAVNLVYAGGYLWSAEDQACDNNFNEPLYRIDPSTGALMTYSSLLGTFVELIEPDPGNANAFLASTQCDFSPSAQMITISGGTPTAGALVTLTNDNNPLMMSPDGSEVFAQNGQNLLGLSSSTLQPDGLSYPEPDTIVAAAASAGDGGVIAFTTGLPQNTSGFSVYRLGNPADLIGTTGWITGQTVEPNGLAFSSNGTVIYAVTYTPTDNGNGPLGSAQLHALSTNALPPPPPYITPNFISQVGFLNTPVGSVSSAYGVTLQNNGPGPLVITGATFSGANPDDFFADPSKCNPTTQGVVTVASGASCMLQLYFLPGALGFRSATMTLNDNEVSPSSYSLSGTGTEGYFQVSSLGAVFPYGNAVFAGDLAKKALSAPIISMTLTPSGRGYWLLGQDGGVFTFGDAGFFGSTGAIHLNKPVVGMTPTPDGNGYWLVASDGGIFSFGDAAFFGSTGAIHLNKPIVGMAATPDGGGYWLVASDGGIFSFGDAAFYGSTGAIHLNKPIVGMAATPDGSGYWMVATDGGIFAFGDAAFYGSTGALHLNKPIVGMAATPDGGGYWLTASDGGVFTFGDAPYDGSTAASFPGQNVVAMTSSETSTLQATTDIPADRHGLARYPHWG